MRGDEVLLNLACTELDESRLHALARDLARSLREAGVGDAILYQGDAEPGRKGDAMTLGAVVLALVQTGGVVVRLLDVLKAYLARKATLRFELTRPDGRKLSLDVDCFGRTQWETTRTLLADLIKD